MKKIALTISTAIILLAGWFAGSAAKGINRKLKPGTHHIAGKSLIYRKTQNFMASDSSVFHLPTLAILRSYKGAATTVVVDTALKGGIFVEQTGSITPDNGITFPSGKTGKYWLRQINYTYVLPEWFGALGNGAQDDAPYINAAIIAANANHIGQVILRNVSYMISESVMMKVNVSLTGSLQSPNTITTGFLGRTLIVASSSLANDAILYDFTVSGALRPINSNLYNVNINMSKAASDSACGVHLHTNTSIIVNNGLQIVNVQVDSCKYYGFWDEFNVNGVKFEQCYASYGSNHGFELDGEDTQLDYCTSSYNHGDGFYVKGNSMRVINCDIWQNQHNASLASGNGIEDIGYLNYYENVVVNGNERNGVLLPDDSTYSGEMKFLNCRVFDNSNLTYTAYSDINIGSCKGVGKSTVFENCQLSYSASDSLKAPAYSITINNKPGYMILSGNTFFAKGLGTSAKVSLSPLVSQYAYMSNNTLSGSAVA